MNTNIIIPTLEKPSYAKPYQEAIKKFFATPVLMELHELKHVQLKYIHGILLPGGCDIDPANYGSLRESFTNYTDTRRDILDLEFARIAFSYDIPILGICRGMQIMYVMNGGKLYQDITASPYSSQSQIKHKHQEHKVKIEPRGQFRFIMECSECTVNSSHHQCIDYKPNVKMSADYPFKVGAVSEDNVAEAIYSVTTHPFAMGIQWHPERFTSPYDDKIFRIFIRNAIKRKEKG